MSQKQVNGVTIEVVEGNIVTQPDVDAVVNAANAQLRSGGGVAGAIHRAAGPGLEQECRPLAPIRPGTCVITGAHNLPNRSVIHCLGPVYGRDEPADGLLASCYRAALDIAEHNGVASIAFPAISTGAFGFPSDSAARIAMETVVGMAPSLASVKHIRFVLFDAASRRAHEAALAAVAG
ncbi:MAG: macro domain-containing protein [Gammaproteobacteria bacterium]|nr:macro domain-containing protein [Gammaproteobacteria bacterium]